MDLLAQAARQMAAAASSVVAAVSPASMDGAASVSSSPAASTALTMRVYPAAGGHIAKLVLPSSQAPGGAPTIGASSTKASSKAASAASAAAGAPAVPLFVILDRSGSMGANVGRLMTQVLPDFLAKISHPASEPITVIAFDTAIEIVVATADMLKANKMNARGGTYMAIAIKRLMQDLTKLAESGNGSGNRPLRILTLTDGELGDQEQTLEDAQRLRGLLEGQWLVNSQAVRIFTSSSQPDTRGLSGMMQLSTVKQSKLLDVDMYRLTMPEIATLLAEQFIDDNLLQRTTLEASQPIVLHSPWKAPSTTLSLSPGENVFWLRDLPQTVSTDGSSSSAAGVTFRIAGTDEVVNVVLCDPLTEETYRSLLKAKIEFFTNQLKVLKVLGTAAALAEVQQILAYFSALDKSVAVPEGEVKKLLESSKGLRDRLAYFKAAALKANRSVSAAMAQIANDERIGKLNSAQAAEYLRSSDSGGAKSKGLARRAIGNGLDFDTNARAEVRAMAAHIDELKDVDDSNHTVSFYSQETTLGGIRAVCELVKDDIVDEMDCNDIMKLLNIVGVACNAGVGDYPDPMTYRLNEIYPGCYVSLADVLTGYVVSHGAALTVPGQADKVIVNVVPFYDDERIHKFLRKYAPKMLEYVASVGMRRMVAEVSMTYSYTLAAGVWSLVDVMKTSSARTELVAATFVKMARAFDLAIGNYFAHLMPYMKPQAGQKQKPALSFCLNKSGVTNMMSPLMRVLPDESKAEIVAPILRALYSYEVWQMVRKGFRHQENAHLVIESQLMSLLGVDIESHKTPMTPLFEPNADAPVWYDSYVPNEAVLADHLKKCWFVDFLTLLPSLLGPASANCSVEAAVDMIKAAPGLNEESIAKALDIKYPLAQFRFFNVFHALMHPTSQDRFDDALVSSTGMGASKFIDVADFAAADAQVRTYVRRCFESRYGQDLSAKMKEERRVLVAELVARIAGAETLEDSLALFRTGLTRGTVTALIANTSSQGFQDLKTTLLDLSAPVKRRSQTIALLLLARDQAGEPVWNGGNVLFVTDMEPFRLAFLHASRQAGDAAALKIAEAKWQALYDAYMLRKRHTYRVDPNRHGHSNDKPSYWALGFAVLEDMVKALTAEEWEAYKRLHHDCCGIPALGELLNPGAAPIAMLAMPASAASSSSKAAAAALSPAAAMAAARAARSALRKQKKNAAVQQKKAAAAASAQKASASSSVQKPKKK